MVIENGTKVSFGRAYAFQADDLAAALGITQVTAKALMKEEFKAAEKVELTDWGKQIEAQFYRPQIEADARERDARRPAGRSGRRRDPALARPAHDRRERIMIDQAGNFDADAMATTAAGSRPTLTLDVALYDRYLEGSGLSDEDRRALLEALWAVIVGFVDLGFAVELAAALEEELSQTKEELAQSIPALVDYPPTSPTRHFEQAATSSTSSCI